MTSLSPSGRYALDAQPAAEARHRELVVRDLRTGASTVLAALHPEWFSLAAGWDARDRLWIRSGDTGMSVYEPAGDGWERRLFAPDGPLEPDPARVVLDVDSGRELSVIGGSPPPLEEIGDA